MVLGGAARLPVGAGARGVARQPRADGRRARRADDLRRAAHGAAGRRRSRPSCRAAGVARRRGVERRHRGGRARAGAAARGLPPALDLVGPMPYVALQSMLDATAPHGWRFYDRLHYLHEVSDGFIDDAARRLRATRRRRRPTSMTGWLGGAIDRVAPGETAFGHRGARALHLDHRLLGDEPVEPVADWVRQRLGGDRRRSRPAASTSTRSTPGARSRDAYARRHLGAARRGQAPLRPGRRLRRPTASLEPSRTACAAASARLRTPSFAEHAADVVLGGLRRDHEPLGDLGVRQARGDQPQHLPLARGELVALAARRGAAGGAELAQQRGGRGRRRAGAEALERVARRARGGRARAASRRRPARARAPAARAPPRAGSSSAAKPATACSSAGRRRPIAARGGDAPGEQRRLGRAGRRGRAAPARPRSRPRGAAAPSRSPPRARPRAAQDEPRRRRRRSARRVEQRPRRARDRRAPGAARTSGRAPPARPRARRAAARPPRMRPWRSRSSASTASGSARPPPRRRSAGAAQRLGEHRLGPRPVARADEHARRRSPRHHDCTGREVAALGELDDGLAPLRQRAARSARPSQTTSVVQHASPHASGSRRLAAERHGHRLVEQRHALLDPPLAHHRPAELRQRHALDVGVARARAAIVERGAGVLLGCGRVRRALGLLDREPAELGTAPLTGEQAPGAGQPAARPRRPGRRSALAGQVDGDAARVASVAAALVGRVGVAPALDRRVALAEPPQRLAEPVERVRIAGVGSSARCERVAGRRPVRLREQLPAGRRLAHPREA